MCQGESAKTWKKRDAYKQLLRDARQISKAIRNLSSRSCSLGSTVTRRISKTNSEASSGTWKPQRKWAATGGRWVGEEET
jgi:roadblock/LC7 domain-containing protein